MRKKISKLIIFSFLAVFLILPVLVSVEDVFAADLPTCSLIATPRSLSLGESFSLAWLSTNATSASISPTIGSVNPVGGSKTITPTTTTTYVGTFTGAGGSKTCSVTVVVGPPAPTCSLTANPTSITQGESSTLSWSSTNTTSAIIDNGIGNISHEGGSLTATPSITTTYTGTFTGAGGSKTCSVTITVTLTPYPCPYYDGQDDGILISFPSDKKLFSNLGVSRAHIIVNSHIPEGNFVVKLAAEDSYSQRSETNQPNESYYLKFTNDNEDVLQTSNSTPDLQDEVESAFWEGIVNNKLSIPVGVSKVIAWHSVYPDTSSFNSLFPVCALLVPIPSSPPAPTCSLTANPTSISNGNSSALTWATTEATSFSIDQGIGNVDISGGSQSVSPTTTTIYTGTVNGTGGTATCSATVIVTTTPSPPAPTCSLTANPSFVIQGESSTLSWSSTNADTAVIDNGIGDVNFEGNVLVSPVATTTYTGIFTGVGGNITCSATIIISSTPPPTEPTCSMTTDPNSIKKGNSSTLSWASTNVTSVIVDNGIGSVNPNGSTSISPNDATTYTGTFTGTEGTVNCSVSISVTSGGCTENCGGGGSNPPNVNLSGISVTIKPDPSFIYLSQIPYTGFIQKIIKIFFMAN